MSEEFGKLFVRTNFPVHSAANRLIRVGVSLRWILPRVVMLAVVKFRSWSDFATAGITKLMYASETQEFVTGIHTPFGSCLSRDRTLYL